MPPVPRNPVSWPTRAAFVCDLYGALRWQGLEDRPARLLVAHSALSTGWGRAVDNYRLAGIKAREEEPYVEARGCEIVAGVEKCWTMKWRAFATLDEGVAAWLGLLRASRYALAWSLLMAGDVEYFAEVGRRGWYTASPATVKAGCVSRLPTIDAALAAGCAGAAGGGSWLVLGALVGGVVLLSRLQQGKKIPLWMLIALPFVPP